MIRLIRYFLPFMITFLTAPTWALLSPVSILGGSLVETDQALARSVIRLDLLEKKATHESGSERTYRTFCSATLISHRWILTAGHCVPQDPSMLYAVFKTRTGTSSQLKRIAIIEVRTMPQYRLPISDVAGLIVKDGSAKAAYDVALMKLAEAPPASYAPIKMSFNQKPLGQQSLIVGGFGSDDGERKSLGRLKTGAVKTLDEKDLKKQYVGVLTKVLIWLEEPSQVESKSIYFGRLSDIRQSLENGSSLPYSLIQEVGTILQGLIVQKLAQRSSTESSSNLDRLAFYRIRELRAEHLYIGVMFSGFYDHQNFLAHTGVTSGDLSIWIYESDSSSPQAGMVSFGDSGGPLLRFQNGNWELVGVHSYVAGSMGPLAPYQYGFSVSLSFSPVANFVKESIKDN